MFFKKMKANDGFTLIELLVVIAVLGILAGIAVPRITGVQDKAIQSVLQANANTIRNAMEMFNAYVGHYPDISDVSSIQELNNVLNSNGLEFSITSDGQFQIESASYDSENNTYSITLKDSEKRFKITITDNSVSDVTSNEN